MKYTQTLLAGLSCLLATSWALASDNSAPQQVLNSARTPASIARDVYRHPQQTLAFFDVTAQSTVVEIWPGGGWYTELLAPLLRDNGKLYAAHFSATSDVAYFSKSRAAFDEKLAANPEIYDKVTVTTLMPPADMVIAPPASADVVVTFRSVHNWLRAANEQQILAAIYAALKPGGVLGVVEHRARPGTDEETMISSGYVTQARVKDMAKLAGFEFVASSEINANPRDSADHPKGVWTLPPSLRLGDQDREKYLAIGESDRMTLKFIKPLE